jgi:hypothetical protein
MLAVQVALVLRILFPDHQFFTLAAVVVLVNPLLALVAMAVAGLAQLEIIMQLLEQQTGAAVAVEVVMMVAQEGMAALAAQAS